VKKAPIANNAAVSTFRPGGGNMRGIQWWGKPDWRHAW